MMLDS
jgi:hypothetical protein